MSTDVKIPQAQTQAHHPERRGCETAHLYG